MLLLLLTIGAIAVIMAVMAIGVAVTGRRLKGSCGGVGQSCACELAGIKPDQRNCVHSVDPSTTHAGRA